MAHEIAKLILEHADSIADRRTAIEKALQLGMPLNEIEAYLDWIDSFKNKQADSHTTGTYDSSPADPSDRSSK